MKKSIKGVWCIIIGLLIVCFCIFLMSFQVFPFMTTTEQTFTTIKALVLVSGSFLGAMIFFYGFKVIGD